MLIENKIVTIMSSVVGLETGLGLETSLETITFFLGLGLDPSSLGLGLKHSGLGFFGRDQPRPAKTRDQNA